MITFTDTETKIDSQRIEEIERWIGLTFPKEYKNHLLKYNGGYCNPNVFGFIENGEPTESTVDWFLAIYDGDSDSLKRYIKTYKLDDKRLPSHIVPIAHDPGGNLICISCGSEDYGYIYFWNHEKEVDYFFSNDSDYSNLYLISKTFDLFLNSLKEE